MKQSELVLVSLFYLSDSCQRKLGIVAVTIWKYNNEDKNIQQYQGTIYQKFILKYLTLNARDKYLVNIFKWSIVDKAIVLWLFWLSTEYAKELNTILLNEIPINKTTEFLGNSINYADHTNTQSFMKTFNFRKEAMQKLCKCLNLYLY